MFIFTSLMLFQQRVNFFFQTYDTMPVTNATTISNATRTTSSFSHRVVASAKAGGWIIFT
jgi:hypothetical protein